MLLVNAQIVNKDPCGHLRQVHRRISGLSVSPGGGLGGNQVASHLLDEQVAVEGGHCGSDASLRTHFHSNLLGRGECFGLETEADGPGQVLRA